MAKFCTNCGRPLNEGEVCNCVHTPTQSGNLMQEKFVNVFKGMFTKPIDTMGESAKDDNFTLGMILVAIVSVATGLFALSAVKNAYSLYLSSMGGLYSYAASSVEVPYLKIFFTVILVMIVLSFIYTGLLYVVNKMMFKRECSFKQVFALYGVSSVIMSVGLLLSAILLFVNVTLGMIVVALASVLNLVYSYHSIKFLGGNEENKYGYIYLITNSLFVLAVYIISQIIS